MASSQRRGSTSSEKKRVESRLVDTSSKQTHPLEEGGRLLIVSHAHLESLEGYDHIHKTLQLSPVTQKDVYCAEIMVTSGKMTGLVCVHKGTCYVNGEEVKEGDKPRKMKTGTFLDLGASHQLQFLSSKVTDDSPVKRVLPQTPGQPTNGKPPSKPPRQQVSRLSSVEPTDGATDTSYSYCGSVELDRSTIDEGLRSRLKRIAKEIASRTSGYQDRKPPPPYEQAGNSIGYQLLHQNHSDVTACLIDRLYPTLKELELKDPELTSSYSSYVTTYDEAREAGATPQCMLPGDIPTIDFVTDVLVNLCCMPHMVSLSEKHAPLLSQILSIFSSSKQNQLSMTERRHTTKILSCMNLTIMSAAVQFQRHGWTVLANTLATPTLARKKPLLSEASLTLAINLIEHQLADYHFELDLSLSIIRFLSVVASTAKRCTIAGGGDEAPPIYTPTQASGIINLLNETKILRHVMKISQDIRSVPEFEGHYSVVVKCLAPTRGKRKGLLRRGTSDSVVVPSPPLTPPTAHSVAPSDVPPPKPKRLFRRRRSTMGNQSRQSKKMKTLSEAGQEHLSTSLTVNGNVSTSKDHETTSKDHLSTSKDHVTTSKDHLSTSKDHVSTSKDHLSTSKDHVTTSKDHVTSSPVSNDQDQVSELNSTSQVSIESEVNATQSCPALLDETSHDIDPDVLQSTSAPELPQRELVVPVKPVLLQEEPAKPEPSQVNQVEPVKQESLQEELVEPESPLVEQKEQVKTEEKLVVEPVKPELPLMSSQHQEVDLTSELTGKDQPVKPEIPDQCEEEEQVKRAEESDSVKEVIENCGDKRNDVISSDNDVIEREEPAVSNDSNKTPELKDTMATESEGRQTASTNDQLPTERDFPSATETITEQDSSELMTNDGSGGVGRRDGDGKTADSAEKTKSDNRDICEKSLHEGEEGEKDIDKEQPRMKVMEGEREGSDTDTQRNNPSCEEMEPHPSSAEPHPPHVKDVSPSLSPEIRVNEATPPKRPPVTGEGSLDIAQAGLIIGDNLPHLMSIDDSLKDERKEAESLVDPPWSPGAEALANDVQDLLSAVRAPLDVEQMVKVPSISRHSRYYRVSVKSSTPKASRRGQEEQKEDATSDEGESPGGFRTQWGSATPPTIVRGHAEAMPFEVSGEFLSTTHRAIEEITSDHQDMRETLLGRFEVASGVVALWRRDKGLQASTNLVQACFSTGRDLVLFTDILQQFLKHRTPWTLAVCFILLPVLRQLLTTQTDERCVGVVCDVVQMIVSRFSELILFSKGKSRANKSRRLSSTVDRGQQEVCYNELHNLRQSLHSRLDTNSDPSTISKWLRKVHAALKPYKKPLEEE